MDSYRASGRWSTRLLLSILVACGALAASAYVGVALFDGCTRCDRAWLSVTVRAAPKGPRDTIHHNIALPPDRVPALRAELRNT